MVILSAALRKILLAHSEEELARIAQLWGIYEAPENGWQENFEQLGELMQDRIYARFAWEHLSPQSREVLHEIVTFEVADGIVPEDLQKLAHLDDTDFAAALRELEQSLLLLDDRPGAKVKARMETRGLKASRVLVIPKDLRELLISVEHEIYASGGDRSKMQLVEVLRGYDTSQLQAISGLYDQRDPAMYYSFYGSVDLAKSIAGKLVQPVNIEYAWTRLDVTTQKLCRFLCQNEGSAETTQIRTVLSLDDAALSKCLHQLEDCALAFDTFSGQQRKVFIGRGTYKVLRRIIEELDEMIKSEQEGPPVMVTLQDEPALTHEAECRALYDLAIVIGSSFQQAIEPTQAGYVPKRVANKIYPLLHSHRPDAYGEGDRYLDILFLAAQKLELLSLVESVGQKARFVAGSELEQWAKLDTVAQMRQLLELWWNPSNYFWSDIAGVNFRPGEYGFSVEMRVARQILTRYLAEHCQVGQWYTVKSLLTTIKSSNHLLLHPKPRYSPFEYNNAQTRRATLAQWDQTDGEIIIGLLSSTLHEFGLISLGYEQALPAQERALNPTFFKLTDLAAQVLQMQPVPEMALPEPVEPKRNLIIQPNFELLLLQPDYKTLYQLLPFVRIEQIALVSRLTLTQESARRGVEAGWSVEKILQTLQDLSQKELPQNILYTLQDWGRLYKDATISQVLLIEVGNEGVADELCSSAKFRALELRRLGPCALAVKGQISLQVLRTTLEKEGLIVRVQGDILNARDAHNSIYYGRSR